MKYDFDIQEMAKNIIEQGKDFDFCKEDEKQTFDDLENALYQLKTIAENEYNSDYWRTLYNALGMIFDEI